MRGERTTDRCKAFGQALPNALQHSPQASRIWRSRRTSTGPEGEVARSGTPPRGQQSGHDLLHDESAAGVPCLTRRRLPSSVAPQACDEHAQKRQHDCDSERPDHEFTGPGSCHGTVREYALS